MDNPLSVAWAILGVGLLVIFVVWLGFKIPAKKLIPDLGEITPEVEKITPAQDLPAPLRRCFQTVNGESTPAPRTVVAYGRGSFRTRKLPLVGFIWAPVAWTLHLIPGQAFVWRMRVYWLRRLIVDGGDEYRNGHGQFSFAHKPVVSPYLDRSQQVALWLNTIAFAPTSLLSIPGIKFEALDENSAKVVVPDADEPLEFTLSFDPASGCLARIETQRLASKNGKPFPFRYTLARCRSFEQGITLPGRLRPAWEEDTYAVYDLVDVRYNGPVKQVMQEGID